MPALTGEVKLSSCRTRPVAADSVVRTSAPLRGAVAATTIERASGATGRASGQPPGSETRQRVHPAASSASTVKRAPGNASEPRKEDNATTAPSPTGASCAVMTLGTCSSSVRGAFAATGAHAGPAARAVPGAQIATRSAALAVTTWLRRCILRS